MPVTGNVPQQPVAAGQRIGRGIVLRLVRVPVGDRLLHGAELLCDCGTLRGILIIGT